MGDRPTPPPEETARWRRHFAVECNNRAWQLAEQVERSVGENEEMVHAAHAAALLWEGIGDETHRARGWLLLGHALGLAGHGAEGLGYARRSLEFFLARECPDWEIAFAHLAVASAARAAGEAALFQTERAEAARLGEAIADPEDREIFLASLRALPAA